MLIKDLDAYKIPWDSIPTSRYHECCNGQGIIISSRGCYNRCTFCTQWKFWGKTWRARSTKNVVDEMEYLNHEYNFNVIRFGDENFSTSKKRIEHICDEISKRKLGVEWSFEGRVDDIIRCKDILSKMQCAGLKSIFIGIETPFNLHKIKKNISMDQIEKAIKLLKEFNITSITSLMIGFRDDTKGSILDMLNYIEHLNPDMAHFVFYTPLPGTGEYDIANTNNWLEEKNFEFFDYYTPIISTETLSRTELVELQKICWTEFHLQQKKIQKLLDKSDRYTHNLGKGLSRFVGKINNGSFNRKIEK